MRRHVPCFPSGASGGPAHGHRRSPTMNSSILIVLIIVIVMQARGYPMGDFAQRAADASVDHPHVVENYRAAHAIASRTERGQASTEDMRQAMVHYRTLFADLIEAREPATQEVRR